MIELTEITHVTQDGQPVPESYRYQASAASVNTDKLRSELAGIPGIVGVQFNPPDTLVLITTAELTPQQTGAVDTMIASHDSSPTAVQVEETNRSAAREAARNALKGAAITVLLQNITEDSADIITDLGTVNGMAVLALATLKPVLLRLLARQARIENRLEMILKILSHE